MSELIMKSFFSTYFELLAWTLGLLLMICMPLGSSSFSLCPLHFLGVSFCPGCGLGRSIHSLFQGDFRASFSYHPLGIPAAIIILHRIFSITKRITTKTSRPWLKT